MEGGTGQQKKVEWNNLGEDFGTMAEGAGAVGYTPYDGKTTATNTTLSGTDQRIVEFSDYRLDSVRVHELISHEQFNPNCKKPLQESKSYWESSPYADIGYYFKSSEPIPELERHFDFCLARKNWIIAWFAAFTIVFQLAEIEIAYDRDNYKYRVGWEPITIMKGFCTLFTLILMYMVYDMYNYQTVGMKKRWYTSLYAGNRPGDLVRGIMDSPLAFGFVWEMILLALHTPPFLDFRYWEIEAGKTDVNPGLKKPFMSDCFGVFIVLRLYLFARVVRDNTPLYARRRLIYEGGYKSRGGGEIDYKLAFKNTYIQKEAQAIVTLLCFGVFVLTYMTWVSERDYQPEAFDYKSCFWFTVFQIVLAGYRGMAAKTTFGMCVSLLVVFFGIIILSLSIAVIFNSVDLSANESWAMDWLREYTLKEKERNAATDYLASWWRYLAMEDDTSMPPDQQRRTKSEYYSQAVAMFNKMSKHTAEMAATEDFRIDNASENLRKNVKLTQALKVKLLGQGSDSGTTAKVQFIASKISALEESTKRCLQLLNELD